MDNQNPAGQIPPVKPQGQGVSPTSGTKLSTKIAIIVIAVLAVGAYFFFSNRTVAPKVEETNSLEQSTDTHIADWQTYKNEDYGFELKYPSEWSINEDNQSDFSTIILGGNKLHVGVSNKSIKDSDICDNSNSKKSTVNIGDLQSSWCVDGNPDDRWVTFANNGTVGVSFYCWFPETQKNIDVCNQILSTFKFTSQSKTSEGQTYKNEQYGFEIKHSSDWVVRVDGKLINIYGPNADLASITIKYYSSLADLPVNPVSNKPYEYFGQYVMDSYYFKDQAVVEFGSETAQSAILSQDASYKVLLLVGNGHFYEIIYKPRYDQTASEVDKIIESFKFTN